MSSGIRRLEKKSGSAGMRNLGSRLNNRPAVAPRPANSTSRSDNIPLAAATGVSSSAQAPVDTRGSVEYTLVSSTQPARTHNVMRLLTSKSVDLQSFTPPVKLRRRNKEYYRLKTKKRNEEKAAALETEESKKREADGGLMEVDGGSEAKKEESAVPIYMVKEKPKIDINLIADRGGARSNKRNLFKKKTKQVFFADEEKRRLDIEEARPWVLEDDDEREVWTGSLEGGQSSTYVLFVLTDDGFKVVPVDRWYKFTPKLKYKTLTLDEAEEELNRARKSEAQDRWIMHKRMVRLDVNADGDAPVGPGGSERVQGSGGGAQSSRSKLVEREIDDDMGFDDDDDDDDEGDRKGKAPKKRGNESGRRAGGEDFDFEMEFDDDEELGDVQFEFNEEEVSQKKEQRQKASGPGYGSEEEEEEDGNAVGNDKFAAKRIDLRKSLRKREGRNEYKSDDEDANPYLTASESDSDEEEEEENPDKKPESEKPEDAAAAPGSAKPASGAQQSGKSATAANASATSAAAAAAAKKRKRVSVAPTGHQHHQSHARASSPVSAASGSSADARKQFKPNTPGGRPTGAASPASSSGSPPPSSSSPASADLITKQEIIDLIKSGVNTTKKLITCVRKKLKANPANKVRIQAIVKEVATLKDGELALKRA
ncbi:transcription factor IIF subunit tfg1 [Coemansia aciculifera]|nr:transcription factor IIF subunit tfg1 [Coemansia aciculifera]